MNQDKTTESQPAAPLLGLGSSEGLGASMPSGEKPRKRMQLFRAERPVMWACVGVGVACTIFTREWQGLGWCLTAAMWWRYSCGLEDQLDDAGA